MGVCLTTGFLSDSEPTRPPGYSTVGVEGANNGQPIDPPDLNPGEISKIFQPDGSEFNDDDWAAIHNSLTDGSGDPAVLQFEVDLASPGFLRVSFVFGSDEYPHWISQFNDTIAILVKGPCTPDNNPGENIATFVKNGVPTNFSLQDLAGCSNLFLKNQMSPAALEAHPDSQHQIMEPPDYRTYYDHEFAGFSTMLIRETAKPLAPGHYTIKFVIEDVSDRKVDSALFIPTGGLKLFALNPGDYNGNGVVDMSDYLVWRHNIGKTQATFYDGDGNGDCVVNNDDYNIWRAHYGETGNADRTADFNRDGCVDELDYDIWRANFGMTSCASRYEGDATGDGIVDDLDYVAWRDQSGNCSGGNAPTIAQTNNSISLTKEQIPPSPDVNGDGVVDEADLAELDRLIVGTDLQSYEGKQTPAPSAGPQPQPTPADPQP